MALTPQPPLPTVGRGGFFCAVAWLAAGKGGAAVAAAVPGRPRACRVAEGASRRGLDDGWTRAGRGAALPRSRCPRRAGPLAVQNRTNDLFVKGLGVGDLGVTRWLTGVAVEGEPFFAGS